MNNIVVILMILAALFAIYWYVIRPWMVPGLKTKKYEGPAKV